MGVNTWAVSVMSYGAEILKWNTDELKSLGRRTRKFMIMHGALHPKSDVDRVYLSREMGRRGSASCEGCLIDGVKAAETIEFNDAVNKKGFKQSWMNKIMETQNKNNVWTVYKGGSPFSECQSRDCKIRSLSMRNISCYTRPHDFTTFARLKKVKLA